MRTERHWRPYPIDPSCILHLPFYKYGAEQLKILDISGNNNHGVITGAIPATYPMLSPIELVSNGGFGSVTTGWAGTDCTLAVAGGGQSGACLQLTRTAGDEQAAVQVLTLVVGREYVLSGWAMSGTSGDEQARIEVYDGVNPGYSESVITSASWQYVEVIFSPEAVACELFLVKDTSTAGTMLFDSISVREVVGHTGLGWCFNGVADEIVITDSPSINFGGSDFTIILWARTRGQLGARYISKRDAALPINVGYEVIFWGTLPEKLGMFIGDVPHGSTTSGLSAGKTIFQNKWQHLAVTFDRDGDAIGYVDCIAGNLPRDISGFAGTVTNTIDLYIGRYAGAAQQFLNGEVGEILFVNSALSAQELRNHYELTRCVYGV